MANRSHVGRGLLRVVMYVWDHFVTAHCAAGFPFHYLSVAVAFISVSHCEGISLAAGGMLWSGSHLMTWFLSML